MDLKQHQEIVKEAVKAKFRGKRTIRSRAVPRYPDSAERELRRIARAYAKLQRDSLKKHMPKIVSSYKKASTPKAKATGTAYADFERDLNDELQLIAAETEKKEDEFGLEKKVALAAALALSISTREWKRVCKDALGVELSDDYYKNGFCSDEINQWVSDNITQIKNIPATSLADMEQVIRDGYQQGKSVTGLQHDIQETYNDSKSNADLLSRIQMASLNAQITKRQQEDAGVTRYEWTTVGDSRVRPCHQALNGKIFSWNDPPEMWQETKHGRVYTGKRCNPGEDYGCRCIAKPVFDIKTLDIPIKGTE